MNKPLIKIDKVTKTYTLGSRQYPILRGVDLEIEAGAKVAIMGASGAGKSTLLHIMGGLDHPTDGQVYIGGRDVYRLRPGQRSLLRAQRIGFVFQAYHLLPELDVLENVVLPTMALRMFTVSNQRRRAMELLERVGLAERAHHRPTELSGGEQQRAAIARALMNDPEIIFADEPTGNLDSKTGEQILYYLFQLLDERKSTLAIVTHNSEVSRLCERVLVLRDGQLTAVEKEGEHK